MGQPSSEAEFLIPHELTLEESLLVRQYRQTKEQKHGGGEWAIKDGELVKLETVGKVDLKAELSSLRKCREV